MESEPPVNTRVTEQGMKEVNEEIREVKGKIDKVEKKIDKLEAKIDETLDEEEKRELKEEKRELKEEKKQLQEEKKQLRDKELILLRQQTVAVPGPSEFEPKRRKVAAAAADGMLSANEALKDERNFVYKCDQAGCGRETSTFYVIDVDHPKRYQTSILLTKKEYRSCDLWEHLTPIGPSEGAYSEVSTCPRVFFWLFDKKEMKRASNPSMMSLSSRMMEVAFDDVLKPVSSVSQMTPKIVKFNVALVFVEEEDVTINKNRIDVEIDELTRNRSIVHQLQGHSILQKFTIGSQMSSSCNITVYSTSREDIVMYNAEKFVQKGVVTGAAVAVDRSMCETLEKEEEEEEEIVEGMTAELKLEPQDHHRKQLIANMTKVAGDLALMAVKDKQTLFDKIKVYGLLVDCKSGSTQVLSLLMNFKEGVSTLKSCNHAKDFNECIFRLSVALDHHT